MKPWVPDVLRHTAISPYFRATGSYARMAEQFGNSEGIIKKHYQGRVSSADTTQIYVHYGDGMGQSKLKIPAAKMGTGRNMNTVAKLIELATHLESKG